MSLQVKLTDLAGRGTAGPVLGRVLLVASMAGLAALATASAAFAQEAAQSVAEAERNLRSLGLSQTFTFFFVMLGPLKILGPFTRLTQHADDKLRRALALRSIMIACIAGILAAVVGQSMLDKWSVQLPSLLIAAGVILFLVALRDVMAQYQPKAPAEAPPEPSRRMAFSPLAFPTIITPYGTAVLILLLAVIDGFQHDAIIVGLFLAVMVLNLLAMLFARQILHLVGPVLGILGALLGVLQVALAVQMFKAALVLLGVLAA
jgi:multiple antibiotic resistance protein